MSGNIVYQTLSKIQQEAEVNVVFFSVASQFSFQKDSALGTIIRIDFEFSWNSLSMVNYTQLELEFFVRGLSNHNQDYILTEIARLPKKCDSCQFECWAHHELETEAEREGARWSVSRSLGGNKTPLFSFPARESLKWPMTQSSQWLCRPLLFIFRPKRVQQRW